MSAKYEKIIISDAPAAYCGASEQTLNDVRKILGEQGFVAIARPFGLYHYEKITSILSWLKLLADRNTPRVVLFVYPLGFHPMKKAITFRKIELNLLKKILDARFSICFIVDLPIDQTIAMGNQRYIDKRSYELEEEFLSIFDRLLVFNKKMKERIQKRYKIDDQRFVLFEILDYCVEQPPLRKKILESPFKIALAGNLSKLAIGNIAEYLPIFDNIEYHLFGPNGNWLAGITNKIRYHGYYSPNAIPKMLSETMHFGLIGRDLGNVLLNEYINLGSTSKFSAYMVSGLPVLVPRQYEYLAYLVQKYNVGIVFDSLKEISSSIESINQREYDVLQENAYDLGKKISSGYHLKKAVISSMADLMNEAELQR